MKKKALTINKRVIVDSPRNMIYDAHLTAMRAELEYALRKRDYFWIRVCLRQCKESTLDADPHLPKEMKARAERLFERFCNVIEES